MQFKTNLQSNLSLIDLTPLVDVILLMLIFFIITSDILPFKSLPIAPPQLDLPSTGKTTQLLVIMDAHHVIYVGNRKQIVDFQAFKQYLSDHVSDLLASYPTASPSIVLSIDRSVDYGEFLRLLALTQEVGLPIRLMYNEEVSLASH